MRGILIPGINPIATSEINMDASPSCGVNAADVPLGKLAAYPWINAERM